METATAARCDFQPKVIPMTGAAPRAVSVDDTAKILGVSSKSVMRLRDRGELPFFKVLGQWRVMLSDLQALVEAQKRAQEKRING